MSQALSRRQFFTVAGGVAAAGLAGTTWAGAAEPSASLGRPGATSVRAALAALGRRSLRAPGSLPDPSLPAGSDALPAIEHIVVLMLENHSYDNLLGMLGRRPGERPRGDGFTIGRDGRPTATNPYADGRIQHAFHMPTTCQLASTPSQEWTASHVAYDGGKNDGFVRAPIGYGSSETVGGVAMGYWTGDDLPFTYALASHFPIGDRWFCSVLGQTDPNRRYLIAATSAGMIDDIGTGPGNFIPDGSLPEPANGTIFDLFEEHGISWQNYVESYPTGATPELYPSDDGAFEASNHTTLQQFFADAADGKLPAFSLIDPNYATQSQENPQNMVVGERLLAEVVKAVGDSKHWRSTLFVLMYDEHGGYYDHVPPPPALAPDSIAPMTQPGQSAYDGFARYGFRVPSVVVSPYAKPDHVSHVVYDHTSVLAMLERKWNLPALTYRDANANDLLDFLDLAAMRRGVPTFPRLPKLPRSSYGPATLACTKDGPGVIPPPGSVSG